MSRETERIKDATEQQDQVWLFVTQPHNSLFLFILNSMSGTFKKKKRQAFCHMDEIIFPVPPIWNVPQNIWDRLN